MRVLIIEDERALAESLQRGLSEEGYVVDVAFDGTTGLERASSEVFDVLVLDRRLPGRNGIDILRELRATNHLVPTIMLTALGDLQHRIDGLDAGADDYLAKPFSFDELLARIRALLRRAPIEEMGDRIVAGPLTVRPLLRDATILRTPINLRPKEYLLLELMARHPHRTFSRTVLAERVWGGGYVVSHNTIDVTISNLRSALQSALLEADCGHDSIKIETVRGTGYRLRSKEQTDC